MSSMGLRRHRVFLLVLVTIMMLLTTGTRASRVLKVDRGIFGNDGLWYSRLPRGPVPPSGPSPCHNMVDPYAQSQFVSPHDQTIICP
ncbi:hypothetical protein QVD17_29244 [Tagetes erecta]|uniref:Uncharacterized protein n=1 Tax=Tagetes erecta TaxID=13708 RepID=A0AAD8KE09_TARER|nr:hypothetical protein QVD17_29244 [Tagetes erecta]